MNKLSKKLNQDSVERRWYNFYFHIAMRFNPLNTDALIAFLVGVFLLPLTTTAQSTDTIVEAKLEDVLVRSYEQRKTLKEIPAAINMIGNSTLQRFSATSIVQAVNTTPGVRMEERSPGSYRFNIRGSSLRSPFGVRNVKVYYNDILITDPGGNTYLNQLGYYNFNSIEIIKGPGSSLYGAGTGGVLSIESLKQTEQRGLLAEYSAGSYGMQNIYGSVTSGGENNVSRADYQHQESDGYRAHSKLKRDVASWDGIFRFDDKRVLKTTFLYGNLFYETPGALTKAEYDANPRAARPGNASFPGAESARASITQKMFIAGASYEQPVLANLTNKTVLYGMFTDLRNPNIQSYEHNTQPHFGGRTTFSYSKSLSEKSSLKVDMGGEVQQGYNDVSIYKNVSGNADTLRTFDEINNRQSLVFAQAVVDTKAWTFTAGSSFNFLRIGFERFAPGSLGKLKRTFSNQLAPRFAILKKLNKVNVYAGIAKGFSPPTTAELAPTGGAVNFDLNAEHGVNYDAGVKGNLFKNVFIDVNAFYFSLDNTIVQRRTAGGGDFFVNAGKTKQYGMETLINYHLRQSAFIDNSMFWLSHTWHNFHYREFKQLTNDFSGKQLPGESPHTISAGFDLLSKTGLLATVTYYYAGKIPLNDANSAYAEAYNLLGLKAGYQVVVKEKFRVKFIAGVDNLLNENYSLGNDVNGFNGRYYNAAVGRNYYGSLMLQLNSHSTKNR